MNGERIQAVAIMANECKHCGDGPIPLKRTLCSVCSNDLVKKNLDPTNIENWIHITAK